MKIGLGWLMLALLCAGMIAGGGPASAQYYGQDDNPTYGPSYGYWPPYPPMNRALGDREVRNLVAPIALYPDPLVGIILPAATFVEDIIDADRRIPGLNEFEIQRRDWDVSVKALAHYPSVLRMMARDPDFGIVRLRAFGTYDFRVSDVRLFLKEVAGSDHNFRLDEFADTMRSRMVSVFSDALASSGIPVLDAAARYVELGRHCCP